ncbi:hypothetical protein BV133_900 [Blastochloris viridis]|uniref:Alkaline proteinase inhibitor/ Outer membrane lipoprotein Omp19 domain-containing protein n=1 Tax=Blastochloris viridis TaxID=1079 RepID=A0A182CZW5_BLAVI|nr:hypothetical protein BV133_900 [Blastochloris viridis]
MTLMLALIGAGAATAETARPAKVPDEVRQLAGPFDLTDAEGHRRCALALEAKIQGTGFALGFDKPTCVGAMPFLATVTSWSRGPASAIRLLDGTGRVVAEFGETEDGLYEMARAGEGVFFLSRAGGTEPAGPTPAELTGTWSFARQPGRPICSVTLTEEPADGDSYRLTLAGTCDQTIKSFAPVSWRLDRADIVITSGQGDQVRFERTEDNIWRRVSDASRPLFLTR